MPSKVISVSTPATEARAVRGRPWPVAVRSTVRCASTRPCVPVTVTRGRTRSIRAVDQCSSRAGRQIPAVTTVGPQSQPKLHAILRMYWNGSG